MLTFSVDDIVQATGCTLVCGDGAAKVEEVTIDSRKACPGMLVVCFVGERVDANDFAPAAIEAGAAAIAMTRQPDADLIQQATDAGCALLRVVDDDGEEFLLRLAGAWRARNPQWAVVGVTGSVGKTTTKEMLAAGLGALWKTHATAGNFNNLIGLPLTLLSASPDDQVIVCEMGMNHAGELSRLTAAARPTVALITNVGTSHIGLLGSRENIARAKAEILDGLAPTAEPQETCLGTVAPALFVTADNDYADFIETTFAEKAQVEVLRVGKGTGDGLALSCGDIVLDETGFPSFTLCFADGTTRPCKLGTPGGHVVADFLLAMAVCDRMGADREACCHAIEHMPATHMRLEVRTAEGKPRVIDDSYNASPTSMAAALDVLCQLPCQGRRIAVLGEMGELGDSSELLHGYVGAYASSKNLDLLVWVGGDGARHMREAALTMGSSEDRMELLTTADEALATIAPILEADDLVLVKASRSVELDRFVKGVFA